MRRLRMLVNSLAAYVWFKTLLNPSQSADGATMTGERAYVNFRGAYQVRRDGNLPLMILCVDSLGSGGVQTVKMSPNQAHILCHGGLAYLDELNRAAGVTELLDFDVRKVPFRLPSMPPSAEAAENSQGESS